MLTPLQELDTLDYARVVLKDGSVINGTSWGIMPAEDKDGNELGYEMMVFMSDEMGGVEVNDNNLESFHSIA